MDAEKTPFTQNTHYLAKSRDGYLASYKDKRAGKTADGSDSAANKRKTPDESPTATGVPASQDGQPPAKRQKITDNPSSAKPISSRSSSPEAAPAKAPAAVSVRQGSASQPFELDDDADMDNADAYKDDDEDMLSLMSLLAKKGYSGLVPEDLGKLNPADEYETELLAMAQIRGYFQVAYKVCYLLVLYRYCRLCISILPAHY